MAMKDYSDEFKADAVALYESTPGATYKSIAADLGVNRTTLGEWVLRDRERRGAAAAAPHLGAAVSARRTRRRAGLLAQSSLTLALRSGSVFCRRMASWNSFR
ncbi:transposase [Streptomyces sp. NL15-2K]|uniref:transposase n=1 Tax=Streptomyces sp. NL15-2K TaxID=376149 RepID=UPI000F58BCAB|nr:MULTISPECIES: transposase [Actinomycetes]WKX08497.1 transposase [Kutzneria buriramensis]